MAVTREFECVNCGVFESRIEVCPRCGNAEVTRKWSNFSTKSDQTKFKDRNIQSLADQYNLTNYSNNINTKHENDYSNIWRPKEEIIKNPNLLGQSVNLNDDTIREVGMSALRGSAKDSLRTATLPSKS